MTKKFTNDKNYVYLSFLVIKIFDFLMSNTILRPEMIMSKSAPMASTPPPMISADKVAQPKEENKQVKSPSLDLFQRAEEAGKEIKNLGRQKQDAQYPVNLSETHVTIFDSKTKLLKLYDLETPQNQYTFSLKSNNCETILLKNSILLISHNDGFLQYDFSKKDQDSKPDLSKVPHELTNAKKMKVDPFFNERFFFLSQNNELYVVQLRDEQYYDKNLYKQNVSWFDLSKKYILFLIDGYYELWRRTDTASEYIWREKQNDKIQYFIDDNFLYEYSNNTVIPHDASDPKTTIKSYDDVWHFWKGSSIVYETKKGITVNDSFEALDKSIVAADGNNKYLVTFDIDLKPDITHRQFKVNADDDVLSDGKFIETQNEIKEEASKHVQSVLNAIKEEQSKQLEALRIPEETAAKMLNKISKKANKAYQDIHNLHQLLSQSGISTKSMSLMLTTSNNPDQIVENALALPNEQFLQFILENEFSDVLPKLKQPTFIDMLPKLTEILDFDPSSSSEVVMDAILQIDVDQNAGNESLRNNADNLLNTVINLYQRLPASAPCIRTIRTLSHIAVSLKNV